MRKLAPPAQKTAKPILSRAPTDARWRKVSTRAPQHGASQTDSARLAVARVAEMSRGEFSPAAAQPNGKVRKNRLLVSLPAAKLASNLRAFYVNSPNVAIDTCAAVFTLTEDPCESLPRLDNFSLIAVDEFSQLSKIHFERIAKLWSAVDKCPALIFCGGPNQMTGFGNDRPWHSTLWRVACEKVRLKQAYRCTDTAFWKKLSVLRMTMPSEQLIRALCRNRKSWNGPPTVKKLRRLSRRFPKTTPRTCARRRASKLTA